MRQSEIWKCWQKPFLAIALSGALATAAWAQPVPPQNQPGQAAEGYGPGMMGMMGAYGPGRGTEPGYGYGPGYGTGQDMMGMMRMMNMMRGCGSGGMGFGMAGGMYSPMMGMMDYGPGRGAYTPFDALHLSSQQRDEILKVQRQLHHENWDLLGKVQDEYAKLRALYLVSEPDPKAIGNQYQKISQLRQKMIENDVEAHNRIMAVLTKEQREQLKRFAP